MDSTHLRFPGPSAVFQEQTGVTLMRCGHSNAPFADWQQISLERAVYQGPFNGCACLSSLVMAVKRSWFTPSFPHSTIPGFPSQSLFSFMAGPCSAMAGNTAGEP